MKKQVAAVAVGASLLAGGAAGAALMTPTLASAESNSTTAAATADATRPQPGAWVEDALAGLVEDGTLTQAQADKVQAALEEARPQGGPGGPGHGHGGPGLEAASEALGIDASELRTQLQDGTTIADIASERGVDLQTVIDAIVADMQSHLDEAVADGRLTQEQADEMKADATERATALVNGERPGPGDGPPGMPAPGATDGATESSSGTTAS